MAARMALPANDVEGRQEGGREGMTSDFIAESRRVGGGRRRSQSQSPSLRRRTRRGKLLRLLFARLGPMMVCLMVYLMVYLMVCLMVSLS